MDTYRKNAIIVGVLYIIGTVSGILSLVFTDSIRSAPDLLVGVSANTNQLIIGALFVLSMGLALAMVPVMMFPILKKHSETLALGYVVFRGGLETVTYIGTVTSWLVLAALSHVDGLDASNIQALGTVLFDAEEIGYIGAIVFILGALMFYTVLFQSKLVPRWLSGWGLIAAILSLAAAFLSIFGLIDSLSTLGVALEMPIALQEMVLAVWLIVKGFNPSSIIFKPA